ncbi:diacylglycerol kinase [Candidatus Roizmanbacteria bacterium CG22_combo_CG10-13_8_21_14_all_34_12]|uniref:Dihydrofolate reductase n=1 Tax=Candidatus Roizmanbacteria bacterium CG22_combo_CG10-13_8_21_14_all_34_12 TaxID=1974860 RepID=A0A2H0C2W0_9BACT|nr:MAG: diacylglycerol kinase [Candidatus Roizmanbacteria bacterium CG22_combo_CG10-13_8_21_14_all_34_12]
MISIIAAIGKNRELGKDNKLLWRISQDFKRFKDLTSNHVVIMGRKTYESLPKKFQPLPNRINVVITRNKNAIKGLINQTTTIFCNSIETALDKAKEFNNEIFIIGGASIYQQGIKYADKLYLTLVDKEYLEADAFFPEYGEFKIVKEENHQDEKYKYKFIELIRHF